MGDLKILQHDPKRGQAGTSLSVLLIKTIVPQTNVNHSYETFAIEVTWLYVYGAPSFVKQKIIIITIKKVRYNCSAHRSVHCSAHLFIIAISSHSHKERKQPRIIFLQNNCTVTIIKIL